ncbi:MAG: phage tail tape measure protein [Spirochaetales bacterium]|nr:phage tail tape measure protein [Spirochaetales bacterium]
MEYKVGVTLGLADGLTGKLNSINEKWKAFQSNTKVAAEDIKWFNDSWSQVKSGTAVAGIGLAMLGVSKAMVGARMESEKLESMIGTLGVTAQELTQVSAYGTALAADMGIAKEQYLRGVYDIKSGISSLNAQDLGKFAKTIAVTATATDGNFDQMSSMFGALFQTYRHLYKDMNDLDMGNLIGNSTALAVKAFRTNGEKIQRAMNSLSSSGGFLNVSLTEQIAVIGALSNQMEAGEAGTAYRAFFTRIGSGMAQLGIDAHKLENGTKRLKTMPEILQSINTKWGHLDRTALGAKLDKAFGEEGAKTIKNLMPHMNTLKTAMEEMGDAAAKRDWSGSAEMADKALDNLVGTTAKLKLGFAALFADAGGPMASGLNVLLKPLASVVGWVAGLGKEHPNLAKIVGITFTLVAAVVTLAGVVMVAQGALNMFRIMNYYSALAQTTNTSASSAASIGQTILATKTLFTAGALKVWAAAQWLVNAAMTANPIGLIVVGIAALIGGIYLLVKHWGSVTGLFDGLKTKWNAMPNWAKGLVVLLLLPLLPFIGIPLLIYKNWDIIKEIPGKVFADWNKLPGWAKFILAGLAPFIGIPLLVIKHWEKIKALPALVIGWLSGLKGSLMGWLSEMGESAGGQLMRTFARGILKAGKAVVGAVVEILGEVGKHFNMSDAKKGPLARTTQYGANLPKTFAAGVDRGASAVPESVQRFAGKAASTLSQPVKPGQNPGAGLPGQAGGGISLNFKSLIGELVLEGKAAARGSLDEMARTLAQVIYREVEKYEGVVA